VKKISQNVAQPLFQNKYSGKSCPKNMGYFGNCRKTDPRIKQAANQQKF
jgi:hypothetical protein